MKISNQLTGIIIFITLILSLPIIGVDIWLATKHNTDCVRFLQWPVIIIGVFILVVSIAGFVFSCFGVAWLLWLYLLVMFLLIVLLLAFTVFAFVVANQGAGHAFAGKGYKEYRSGDYSTSLQRRVENSNNRDKIQGCLSDAKFYSHLNKYNTIYSFDAADLSPVQPHEVLLNQQSLKLLTWWTWQFVIIRLALSILMIALQLLGLYKGAITWILTFILNASVSLAMYSLLNFYHLFGKELAPDKPLPKFLCIKGVVFFSFW